VTVEEPDGDVAGTDPTTTAAADGVAALGALGALAALAALGETTRRGLAPARLGAVTTSGRGCGAVVVMSLVLSGGAEA
jgi:hypothetical protein